VTEVVVPVVKWWLALAAIGWAAVPLAWRLFPTLPDRGLAFARPLGLLVAGYVFWLGGIIGVVPNSPAGAWLVGIGLVFVAAWLVQGHRAELESFLRARRRLVLGYEALFLAGLAGWAFYRAFNPNIETAGGEKYMEMAFISAVVGSPQFPPLDPWMSGHTISYYYFNYIIAGMLVQITGVARAVAFNLLVPMTLGMTLVGAFSLGYNLVALSEPRVPAAWPRRVFAGAFTAALLALFGSLEGALELGYIRGWGPASLYNRLNVMNLTVPVDPAPAWFQPCGDAAGTGFGAGGWVPTRFIWWWRGSRVLHDNCNEMIHEFPFFSFMLADAHPHTLTLPYVLVVLGLALAVLAGSLERFGDRPRWSAEWLLLPLIVGALGFFNTWDLPTYGFVLALAYALRALARPATDLPAERSREDLVLATAAVLAAAALGWRLAPAIAGLARDLPPETPVPLVSRVLLAAAAAMAVAFAARSVWKLAVSGDATGRRLWDVLRFTAWLAAGALVFYLPFHIGFQSQASGISVVEIRSRLGQWLVHFGLPFALALSLVAVYLPRAIARRRPPAPALVLLAVAGPVALVSLFLQAWTALALVLVLAAAGVAGLDRWMAAAREVAGDNVEGESEGEGGDDRPDVAEEGGSRGSSTTGENGSGASALAGALPVASTFALLCVAVGLLLPLGTEFVFIRDIFNARMNSIFKLYFQAWTLLAVGGGYAVYAVRRHWPRRAALAWAVPIALLVAGSLYYPLAATYDRTNGFTARADGGPESGLSLDGLRWWKTAHPSDIEAARWLEENAPPGTVVLEASTDGGYSHNGRMAMATGRPTVLGWGLHEWQWRGTREEVDPRHKDVETIYKTGDRVQVLDLLERYRVRFVVLGASERAQFGLTPADEQRLEIVLGPPVWQSDGGDVKIFERPG